MRETLYGVGMLMKFLATILFFLFDIPSIANHDYRIGIVYFLTVFAFWFVVWANPQEVRSGRG